MLYYYPIPCPSNTPQRVVTPSTTVVLEFMFSTTSQVIAITAQLQLLVLTEIEMENDISILLLFAC